MSLQLLPLVLDQLITLIDSESSYVVHHIPCQCFAATDMEQQQRPIEQIYDWRRKMCQWSFRVIDHLRRYVPTIDAGLIILF
jgi:hypothetical protein